MPALTPEGGGNPASRLSRPTREPSTEEGAVPTPVPRPTKSPTARPVPIPSPQPAHLGEEHAPHRGRQCTHCQRPKAHSLCFKPLQTNLRWDLLSHPPAHTRGNARGPNSPVHTLHTTVQEHTAERQAAHGPRPGPGFNSTSPDSSKRYRES